MALQPDDVTRMAQLARLALSDVERADMLAQLNSFFRIVERMSAVDTQGIEPLATPLSVLGDDAMRLREDRVLEAASAAQRELNQRSAPLTDEGLYLVPRVVE
jgi:aspartyl-tRNA(Asn)/glutamyl-tRNA(Gln) amidotransferase subunit C